MSFMRENYDEEQRCNEKWLIGLSQRFVKENYVIAKWSLIHKSIAN